ncbi:MAG TPA: DUF2917 domain-containing protein [Rhodocyclaceae bacterium]|nr:DUF2917 domain-containing protein [Rhodocyclaceae bacterium]
MEFPFLSPRLRLPQSKVRLHHGELLALERAKGCRLHCHQGRVAVSLPGVWEDWELTCGESLLLDRPGLVLVEATGSAEVQVVSPRGAQGAETHPSWPIMPALWKLLSHCWPA